MVLLGSLCSDLALSGIPASGGMAAFHHQFLNDKDVLVVEPSPAVQDLTIKLANVGKQGL